MGGMAVSKPRFQDEIKGFQPLSGDMARHPHGQSTTAAKHCQLLFSVV
jgi:hypothetical protein